MIIFQLTQIAKKANVLFFQPRGDPSSDDHASLPLSEN